MIANIFSVRLPSGASGNDYTSATWLLPGSYHNSFAEMQNLYSDFATCQTKSGKVQVQYI
jgi:hypothetical protein